MLCQQAGEISLNDIYADLKTIYGRQIVQEAVQKVIQKVRLQAKQVGA